MSLTLQIILVAIAVSLSCAVIGVFLVLRGATMVSDAITHTVLLGIVLSYFVVEDLNSPLLMIGATLMGVFTVWLIETIRNTGLVKQDSSIGIVFPFLFSIAIILITQYASDVHLDVDSVFMGQLGFTVFDRLIINGVDLGPQAFWNAVIILILNSAFVGYFYKELKVSTFDPLYAASIGISTTALNYALMTLVSLTAVGAFESVGSILVVGLMVGPALTGYLLSNDVKHIIGIAVFVAIINSVVGVLLAQYWDLSYAGVIAGVTGVVAIIAFFFSPKKGYLLSYFNRKKNQRKLDESLE